MASTYTDNNGIEKPGTGEQSGTWGDTVNTNMDLLDEALEGQVTVTLSFPGTSGAPNTFAIADGTSSDARHRYITFDDGGDLGGSAFVQLTPSNAAKIYFVKNALSAGRSLTMFQGTYDAGRDVEIGNGETYLIAMDGGGSTATTTKIGEIPTATGTIAAQDANSVNITGGTISGVSGSFPTMTSPNVTVTGGTITGITDLTVADGGTGASTAASARANLGLAIGSDVQAHNNNLDQIATLAPNNNSFIVGNGSAWTAETPSQALSSLGITATAAEINNLDGITPAGAALLDDANNTAQRATLGLGSLATANIVTTSDVDFYETGTWTPVFSYATGFTATGLSLSNNPNPNYTRIGNLVFIRAKFTLTGNLAEQIAAGDVLALTGLPYNNAKSLHGIIAVARPIGFPGNLGQETVGYLHSYANGSSFFPETTGVTGVFDRVNATSPSTSDDLFFVAATYMTEE